MPTINLYYYSFTKQGLPLAEPELLRALDSEERGRYQRLLRAESRQVFAHSRYLIKRELAQRLGLTLSDIHFSYSENGKPFLPGNPLYFNLSHCDSALAFALADAEVGVDIEKIHRRGEPWKDAEEFINQCVAKKINRYSRQQDKAKSFCTYWSAMEAYTKLKAGRVWEEKEKFAIKGETLKLDNVQNVSNCFIQCMESGNGEILSVAAEKPFASLVCMPLSLEVYVNT